MICAVILAAGASRRMGTNKLLLPFAGTTVIRHIVSTLHDAGIGPLFVVTGHAPEVVENELAGFPVTFAHNPDFEQDMLSSVRRGLQALPADCRGVCVAPGDHPGFDAALLREMTARFDAGARIVVPRYNERRGHPLLFHADFIPEVLREYDSQGLRGLLRAHPQYVAEVQCNCESVTLDLDTPSDYERLLKLNLNQ